MKVVVATEYRFDRGPDGVIRAASSNRGYPFWERYLECFESVAVLGRVHDRNYCSGVLVEGSRVEVVPLPGFIGLSQFVKNSISVWRGVQEACVPDAAYILRVPGTIGTLLFWALRKEHRRYALEIVGDPAAVFAPGVVNHPIRSAIRVASAATLRVAAKRACIAAYVTSSALQKLYPCPQGMVSVSDVELPPAAFINLPREPRWRGREIILVLVGSLEQLYKGPDTLIEAVRIARQNGIPCRAKIVGGGRCRATLEEFAEEQGVAEYVSFLGEVQAGPSVRAVLDAADVFVMPSRTEGLPRALLEAMARGLPAIASNVGGIPELLDERALIAPNDATALAGRIAEIYDNYSLAHQLAAGNLELAHEYSLDLLDRKRAAFYEAVRRCTQC